MKYAQDGILNELRCWVGYISPALSSKALVFIFSQFPRKIYTLQILTIFLPFYRNTVRFRADMLAITHWLYFPKASILFPNIKLLCRVCPVSVRVFRNGGCQQELCNIWLCPPVVYIEQDRLNHLPTKGVFIACAKTASSNRIRPFSRLVSSSPLSLRTNFGSIGAWLLASTYFV